MGFLTGCGGKTFDFAVPATVYCKDISRTHECIQRIHARWSNVNDYLRDYSGSNSQILCPVFRTLSLFSPATTTSATFLPVQGRRLWHQRGATVGFSLAKRWELIWFCRARLIQPDSQNSHLAFTAARAAPFFSSFSFFYAIFVTKAKFTEDPELREQLTFKMQTWSGLCF